MAATTAWSDGALCVFEVLHMLATVFSFHSQHASLAYFSEVEVWAGNVNEPLWSIKNL